MVELISCYKLINNDVVVKNYYLVLNGGYIIPVNVFVFKENKNDYRLIVDSSCVNVSYLALCDYQRKLISLNDLLSYTETYKEFCELNNIEYKRKK